MHRRWILGTADFQTFCRARPRSSKLLRPEQVSITVDEGLDYFHRAINGELRTHAYQKETHQP